MSTQDVAVLIAGGAGGIIILGVLSIRLTAYIQWWWKQLRGRDYRRPMFRPGTVYLFIVYRPRPTWWGKLTAVGYVGQTRHPDYLVRIGQHLHGYRGEQPKWWAGDVVSYRAVWSSKYMTTWGLDFREWLLIKLLRPLHNYKMNTRNRRRVTPPVEVIEEQARKKSARLAEQARLYGKKHRRPLM